MTTLAKPPEVVYARDVREFDADTHRAILEDAEALDELRSGVLDGNVYICRSLFPRETLDRIRRYLANIGRSSLPNYCAIDARSPNFHRINNWDQRAYVGGGFHQFSFFPWNQDVFGLFALFAPVFHLKNRLAALRADKFLGSSPEDGCTARLSFQFYPRGVGGMNAHTDPYDHHQIVVPAVALSRRGEDFESGGLFVERADGQRIDVEGRLGWGDVVYFYPQIPHGVAPIDPDEEVRWLDFQGRWLLICAVNRLQSNASIANSRDLEKRNEQ